MDNNTNIKSESHLKTLWVLLSALGLLIIVGGAGIIFFSNDTGTQDLKPVLAATTIAPQEKVEEKAEDFDPIEWSRESDEYPGLEVLPEEEIQLELAGDETLPEIEEDPVVEIAPVVEAVVEKPKYKDVTVQVYWIQVGSYSSMTKAETVSDTLKEKGLNSTVQTKDVNGKAVFRVRIGAFNTKEEADKFNIQVSSLEGYEESFVIQSSLTKQVPVNS